MERRHFLKVGITAAVGSSLLGSLPGADAAGGLERRPFGRTGHNRSVVTLGGIVVMSEEQGDADRLVAEALAAGVNGVDVSPTYGDAELKLGHALLGQRDQVFLGCKTAKRDKAGAAAELRNSLQRLQTDHVDLYQFHGLDKPEELAQVMGPDGALEAFQEARQQGLIRFIGMTSHRPDTLLKAIGEFQFDSVVLPYNFILAHYGYGKALLEEAGRQGLAVSAIKPLAESCWGADETHTCPKTWYKPFTDEADVRLCMRWILGQRVTTAIPSGDMRLFRLALAAAQQYTPLTADELAALDVKATGLPPLFPNA